ncbi:MAG: adenylyltransferase/cytidyltransferase family protein [Euryarchaeota archaeon]|nr:adenylyltransferase/cytidyltransferase family protein [Euryarchaeota archaeon]
MTRVLATGTFDILHPGHLFYLSQASALGSELYVIVARASMIKHKPKPILPDEHRLEMVQALKVVDRAVLGSERDIFEPLYEIRPDIIALGYDQCFDIHDLKAELVNRGFDTEVVRIEKTNTDRLCSTRRIVDLILHHPDLHQHRDRQE